MARDPRAFLWDVRESADAILRFTAARTEREYRQDEMLRAAVERHFEIIGEALNRLTRANPALATRIPGARQAIAFRNLLIHGYAVVDDATVWRTVRDDLPGLRETVAELLGELDDDPDSAAPSSA